MTRKQAKYENRNNKRLEKRCSDNAEYDDYNKVFTYDHLLESAKKCKRNVGWKASVQNFFLELYYNVFVIYLQLVDKKFKIKTTHEFDIHERGKKRHIRCVHIRERIVQRCLCDYCLLPILRRTFIYDNCASLKGKGTAFALNRVKYHMNSYYREHDLDGYVLLFDFHDFFASVPHKSIMRLFEKYIMDKDILHLLYLFIKMESGNRGLCLGNEVSQVAALLIASPIDHYIKDKCGVKHYIRYMDDGMVIHQDKKFLKKLLKDICNLADELGIEINIKKTKIIKISNEFVFLKKKIHMTNTGKIYMRIMPRSINTMRRKLKKLYAKMINGEMSYYDIESAYQAWRNYAITYNSYGSVKSMDNLFYRIYGDYITNDTFWTYPVIDKKENQK